jgi:predicted ATPase
MITKFGVRNLKGIEEAELELRPVTILIGPNRSGKSTIAQALLLLKQSIGFDSLQTEGTSLKLGAMGDLVPNLSYLDSMDFLLEGNHKGVSYREQVSFGASVKHLAAMFRIKNKSFRVEWDTKDQSPPFLQPDGIEGIGFRLGIKVTRDFAKPISLPGSSSSSSNYQGKDYQTDDQTSLIKMLNQQLSVIERDLNHIWYISPVRGATEYFYPLQDRSHYRPFSPDIALRSRNEIWMTTVAYHPDLLETVSKWCEYVFGIPLSFRMAEGKNIAIETAKEKHIRFNIINEGFGLNQLAYLLTQLALTPEESILAIDEPEIHLHPGAQIKLMDVLVEEALDKQKTLLLATHSEHIVYHTLTLIGLKKLKPDQLSIYHFEKGKKGYRATPLKFNERGQLEEGLPGFLEVNVDQFKRYIDILAGSEGAESTDD